MPRDAGGNYTLPSGNPVLTGTVITSSWANPTMSDLGNEITNSLSRSGQGGMLVPLEFFDGTINDPSITFTTEPTLGVYRSGAGILGISGQGISIALFKSADGNVEVSGSAPAVPADLTRKDYVDAAGTALQAQIDLKSPNDSPAFTGNLTCTGNITSNTSDDRLKDKLGPIENALKSVSSLNGFIYKHNALAVGKGLSGERQVGVSAQEVQVVLPEAVTKAPIDENFLTVRYEKLVPLLIEAVKELSAKVDALENK